MPKTIPTRRRLDARGRPPSKSRALSIRYACGAVMTVAPTVERIMSWRGTARAAVERWAARELLIRSGSSRRPLEMPGVLRRAA